MVFQCFIEYQVKFQCLSSYMYVCIVSRQCCTACSVYLFLPPSHSPLVLIRMVDEVLCEMQCTLHIDIEVLRSSSTIPYKYIVYSPKRKGKDSFEFIHHAPIYGITNRCLSIPSNVLHAPGLFVIINAIFMYWNALIQAQRLNKPNSVGVVVILISVHNVVYIKLHRDSIFCGLHQKKKRKRKLVILISQIAEPTIL